MAYLCRGMIALSSPTSSAIAAADSPGRCVAAALSGRDGMPWGAMHTQMRSTAAAAGDSCSMR